MPDTPLPSLTMNEHEVAVLVGVSVHTLRKWRRQRRGPRFCKIAGAERPGHGRAGRVTYRRPDVERFLENITVQTRAQ